MKIISEEKSITGVSRIILREHGHLFISQGAEESLRIEGQDAMTRMVKTEVRNGELLIDLDGGWWDKTWGALSSTIEGKPLKYYVTVKRLEGLFITGAARVKADGLKLENFQLILKGAGEVILSNIQAKRLDIELPGAGVISLSGKAKEQIVYLKGAGSYDAPRLETENTNVKLHGVGKATVWATKTINAHVDGVGSIEYYGSPEVRKSVSGLGKVFAKSR
ncbi:MAG: head GIN domain-containing protein [Bacteroidota bacterium]|nr:head GIN domain-containing protein [Bacteroidota bacterium]